MTDTTGRRAFLSRVAKIATGAAVVAALPTVLAGTASAAMDGLWCFCTKCYGLFSGNVINFSGVCPAGGQHSYAGYIFSLPYNVSENANAQANWWECGKCLGLYYRGYPSDGVCPAGAGHNPSSDTVNHVLTHDVPQTPTAQDSWRFCVKCYVLFFNGYPTAGRCPTGGEHKEAGYNFVLAHN
ncbi:hypothetical protein [Kutzneria sp. NPDC052558]|uniref:hypothetical protein n=1 Tax=Kutzneria sp. NPDC052558 TaxID=3364121 RepID=UPI0037CB1C9C